jgi:hypothetical protein
MYVSLLTRFVPIYIKLAPGFVTGRTGKNIERTGRQQIESRRKIGER